MGRCKNYKSPSSMKRSAARLTAYLIKMIKTKMTRTIICNSNEDESMKSEGSDKDVEELEKLFEFLKFKVDVHKDLSKDEIISKVQEFSENLGKDVDRCAVCIMSHGRRDVIGGRDGLTVDIELDILEHFTNKNCP